MADLISSEAIGGRFHPNSFGFHPAKQDFIKFVWLAGILFIPSPAPEKDSGLDTILSLFQLNPPLLE